MTTTVGAPERRRAANSTVALLVLAGVAWVATIAWITALDMSLGAGTMGLGPVEFIVMWTLMMAAMMLPAVSPLVSLYARSVQRRARRPDGVRRRLHPDLGGDGSGRLRPHVAVRPVGG